MDALAFEVPKLHLTSLKLTMLSQNNHELLVILPLDYICFFLFFVLFWFRFFLVLIFM